MSKRSQVDYIIVGMGLAGSCLAYQLTRRKRSVVVFDEPSKNKSTSVAAGLINPITGKMMAKNWEADILFPYMTSFYKEAEKIFETSLFTPALIYSPFASVEEQNTWMGHSTQPSLKNYIKHIYLSSSFGNEVHDPVGGVMAQHGGYLHTEAWCSCVRHMLEATGAYREEEFHEEELTENPVSYQQIDAKKIIFCRGVDELNGQYFSKFPIRPLKGETLTIHTAPLSHIYNRGVYIVPAGHTGIYRVGATYDRDGVPGVTEEGRSDLVDKLNALLISPYKIVSHEWGIRPTTTDRRPLLGCHSKHQNLLIFNGLGTKGALLAPYFSGLLCSHLEGESEIPREVNITRFKSLYSRFER